jgi:hypothetical protein
LLVRGGLSDVLSEDAQNFLTLCPQSNYVNITGAGHMVAGDRNDVFANGFHSTFSRMAGATRRRWWDCSRLLDERPTLMLLPQPGVPLAFTSSMPPLSKPPSSFLRGEDYFDLNCEIISSVVITLPYAPFSAARNALWTFAAGTKLSSYVSARVAQASDAVRL